MDYEMLDNILSDAVNDSELRSSDIPAISLYLDQIIHLISDRAEKGSTRFYGRIPTKTMVNNYSKAGLITPINGKKYSGEQIIQMLMINSLKNTFSIAEIKSAMDAFYENAKDGETLLDTYDKYLDMKERAKLSCPCAVKEMIEENGFDISTEVGCLGAILGVAAMADYMNCIAHAMLEVVAPQRKVFGDTDEVAMATKATEKQVKQGAKAVKKETKRENKALKKAEKGSANGSTGVDSGTPKGSVGVDSETSKSSVGVDSETSKSSAGAGLESPESSDGASEGFINASKAGGTEPVLNSVENDNTTSEE